MPLISSPNPSAGRMTGPPVPPPNVPTLSSFQSAGGGGTPGTFNAGAVPKLFFTAEQALDEIATSVPTIAADIDRIKGELRDVMSAVLAGGANAQQEPIPRMEEGLAGVSGSL